MILRLDRMKLTKSNTFHLLISSSRSQNGQDCEASVSDPNGPRCNLQCGCILLKNLRKVENCTATDLHSSFFQEVYQWPYKWLCHLTKTPGMMVLALPLN